MLFMPFAFMDAPLDEEETFAAWPSASSAETVGSDTCEPACR